MSTLQNKKTSFVWLFFAWFTALGMVWFLTDIRSENAAADASSPHTLPINLEPVGHIGGLTRAAFISGTLAYVGNGSELTILDVSNPSAPTKMGDIWWKENVNAVQVVGDYAYIGTTHGLQVVNVANPTAPTVVGSYIISHSVSSVAIDGAQVYLGTGDNGLHIVDVSNPTSPSHIQTYEPTQQIIDVTVGNEIAYVSFTNTVHLVDITAPTVPTFISSYTAHKAQLTLANGILYVASYGGGVYIVDVSDPTNPNELSFYHATYNDPISANIETDVAVSGSLAYVIYIMRMQYSTDSFVFDVLDVTTPSAPVVLREGVQFGGTIEINPLVLIQVKDDHAYVTGQRAGLFILDVTTPTTPTLTAQTGFYLENVEVKAQKAFGLGGGTNETFYVVDLAAPSEPQVISSLPLSRQSSGLWLKDSYVYTIGRARHVAVVQIIDVSDPSVPTVAGTYFYPPMDITSLLTALAFKDNYMYVSNYANETIDVVDITDPHHPTRVGEYPLVPYQMTVVGDYLYADGSILDISNPVEPVLVDTYPNNYYWNEMEIQGSRAYVTECYYQSGVIHTSWNILDVSNPAAPVVLSTWPTTGCNSLGLFGKYLMVSNQSVNLLDVTDANNPVVVATLFPYSARPRYAGGTITLQNVNGLYILDAFEFLPERIYLPSVQRVNQ